MAHGELDGEAATSLCAQLLTLDAERNHEPIRSRGAGPERRAGRGPDRDGRPGCAPRAGARVRGRPDRRPGTRRAGRRHAAARLPERGVHAVRAAPGLRGVRHIAGVARRKGPGDDGCALPEAGRCHRPRGGRDPGRRQARPLPHRRRRDRLRPGPGAGGRPLAGTARCCQYRDNQALSTWLAAVARWMHDRYNSHFRRRARSPPGPGPGHTAAAADRRDGIPYRPGRTARPGALLAIILIGQLMAVIDVFIVNVGLPTIRSHLHASGASLQLIVAGYTIAYAVLLVTGARLGAILGYARMFLTGTAVFTLASLGCGLAGSADQLIGLAGKLLSQIEDHADWIFGVAWSPDGKRLASASRDKTAKVFDIEKKESLVTFPGHAAAGLHGFVHARRKGHCDRRRRQPHSCLEPR